MATERLQRRIERLLDQVEDATDQQDWDTVLRLARQVLSIDPDNADAAVFLKIAELESGEAAATSPQTSTVDIATEDTTPAETAPAYAPPAEVDFTRRCTHDRFHILRRSARVVCRGTLYG